MSDAVHSHESHGHHDDHAHGHHDEGAHGSYGSYMIGFGLSVILTAIPFWLVMSGTLGNPQLTGFIIMAFAAVQVVVHMIYFLHMNTRVEGGWSFMAMMLTIVLVVITLSGSMWVMYHLNANMMPHADMNAMQHMSEMP
ncbi:MAG TPA: cytochrome o ubiquinol oxidase subunit IV [Sphingobium sp.]|jgi:cytochrome o ubiquinol oxidase operon protein cyoD|uniref:cytochrome o ubiquinol oxidase subunit IV n=1 Tax=unclassified Sphingobium TaxID=2611147 RepID=UPI0007F38D56|nr:MULTISPECIES: cytochrome o ubiquinol oxidase subunit IV [unclassified Sphingobium]OAN56156.1 cytochrome o ubiquinol oxidase subunit IV [Sphingobium sp. TCM1]WIW89874.1 cytochrome o ubiquinol oxidase subunit IV [Sphingobium sp. V4]HAF40640.1 cytochrome o ubiquinol oxidase subunit IV [Sphingobium sp.]